MSFPSLEDLLARLEGERVEADRLYNDALTAVDRAIQSAPALPGPPLPYDAAKVEAINQSWDILPSGSPAVDRSLRGRLRGFIWRLIGPSLETQKQFNAALVEHLNRNVGAHEDSQRAIAALIDAAREQFQALTRFESLLVQYLQTVTLYVDTKDRAAGGNELRERITLIEQRIAAMKRALDAGPVRRSAEREGESASTTRTVFTSDLDSVTYVGFEDKFRGSQADIRSRIGDYVPMFASASNVLDVGCGRGELLDLLRSRGVAARGIDVNRAMVDICRERGLAVEQADAVSYLGGQADASLGGLIALQVVEHFEPAYLLRFLELAHHTLQPGAPLVLETINPACWMAFFETYIRDLTHQRPLHPDTLRYLVQASGFTSVDVQFRAPVTEGDRLDHVAHDTTIAAHAGLTQVAAVVNAHADKLNARLFSSMDYAVIARR